MSDFSHTSECGRITIYGGQTSFWITYNSSDETRSMGDGVDMFSTENGECVDVGTEEFYNLLTAMLEDEYSVNELVEAYFWRLEEVSLDELLDEFDQSVHPQIEDMVARGDVTHLVVFADAEIAPRDFYRKQVLAVGPGCTYKDPAAVIGQHLGDLPSQRTYPVRIYKKGDDDETI